MISKKACQSVKSEISFKKSVCFHILPEGGGETAFQSVRFVWVLYSIEKLHLIKTGLLELK